MRFRAFAGPSDFEATVACANASFAADQTGFFRKVEDVARDYATFTECVPQRDVWIAEADAEIAGYVRAWHWAQADGVQLYGQFAVVAPQWRRRGIGAALHAWLESRQREMAAAHRNAPGHAHHAFVTQGETARAALLDSAGNTQRRRWRSHAMNANKPTKFKACRLGNAPGGNYIAKIEELARAQGASEHEFDVMHDDWCALLKHGQRCDCAPDVSVRVPLA